MEDNKFKYMLLSRLEQDCEYWLGFGKKSDKHLWAGSPAAQIEKMKELYGELPEAPDWLTMAQINEYASRMGAA